MAKFFVNKSCSFCKIQSHTSRSRDAQKYDIFFALLTRSTARKMCHVWNAGNGTIWHRSAEK